MTKIINFAGTNRSSVFYEKDSCSANDLVADRRHRTGIDDVGVRGFLKGYQRVAPAQQLLLHSLSLVLIHLAAQRVKGDFQSFLFPLVISLQHNYNIIRYERRLDKPKVLRLGRFSFHVLF